MVRLNYGDILIIIKGMTSMFKNNPDSNGVPCYYGGSNMNEILFVLDSPGYDQIMKSAYAKL